MPYPTSDLAEREREGTRKSMGSWCVWRAAHCGTQGRSRVLERDGGRELEGMASSGSAWNLPGEERSHRHFLTPTSSYPQTRLHIAPRHQTHTPPKPARPKHPFLVPKDLN